jgi:CBS domain-containing protein
LIAAAERPRAVRVVVSRGGRPTWPEVPLERVEAPTLLIVGGPDTIVVELNEQALDRLGVARTLRGWLVRGSGDGEEGTRSAKKGVEMAKSVREAMTAGVRTVSPSQSLAEAAEVMKGEDIGSVPVVEEGRVAGILTDRDIVIRAVAERRDPQTVKVDEIASRELVTVEPEQDLDEALALMARHQVRRLPVVEEGRLVGMLAQADVALEAKEKKVGETVEEISQPTSTERE